MEYCCDEFTEAVRDEDITRTKLHGKMTFWMYGAPSSASDGGGHYDDMTEEMRISYCPFCGEKLYGGNIE